MKPFKRILTYSVLLTLVLYFVDIYILDPIAPDPSWGYRISNFLQCLLLYGVGFFLLFSFVYICYSFICKFLSGGSNI